MDLPKIKKVGLFVKPQNAAATKLAITLTNYLLKRYEAVLSASHSVGLVLNNSVTAATIDDICRECQLVLVVGGDGTLLAAGHSVSACGIPLIGINLGKLGFLVEIPPKNVIDELDKIFAGKFNTEMRCLLHVTYWRNGRAFKEYDACNDVVVKHKNSARMIELEAMADDVLLSSSMSDGLIISTPTGSTAYALSSGGPIIEPLLDAILLAPICPHTLTYRPMVVSPERTIKLIYTKENIGGALVSIDGQINDNLNPGDHIVVKLAPYKMTLIQPLQHNYFETLRLKLGWGKSF